MFPWKSKAKKTNPRKKITRYVNKFTFEEKESFRNENDVLIALHNAFEIPEEILLSGDDKLLTNGNSKVDSIVKNVATAVKCQDILYRGLNTDKSHEEKKKAVEDVHSVLFYCVLKNNGFECEEADKYYEVLEGSLPELDWNIYLSIVITCHWSELFAKCISQLPDGVAATVLKLVITETKRKSYSDEFILCHGVIQALMFKLFPNQGALTPVSHIMFQFPFQVSVNSNSKTDISPIDNVPNNNSTFIEILGLALDFISSRKEQKFTIVLLNGLITAFDLFIKCEMPDKVNKIFINLEQYITFIEKYFQSEDVLSFLKTELETFHFFSFIQTFTMEEKYHWLCGYLLLLINEKWQEIKGMVDHENKMFKILDNLVEMLFSTHPIKVTDKPVPDEYVRLLISLLKNDLDGRKSAFDILSGDINFLQRADVQGCIAKDIHMITDSKRYDKLVSAAFSASGSEKEQLFNLFLSWYRSIDHDLKVEILQSCLSEFGLSAFNKSVDFNAKVTKFFNTAVDLDTAVFFLYQFCIESPQETLQEIITNVIEHGSASLVLIQALKSVSFVCSYQRTSGCLPLLIEVLKQHLIGGNLSSVRKKNVHFLVEELMKVFPSDTSFSRYHFIMHCVLPNLSSNSGLETMEFSCDLLNLILSESVNTGFISWLTEIRPLPLMQLTCSMLNYCLFYHNTQFKDDIINIVNIFHELNNKFQVFEKLKTDECQKQLQEHLKKANPIVKFYVVDFIVEPDLDVPSLSIDLLLFWCIIRENMESLSESELMQKLSVVEYPSFVKAVAKDIIDLTFEEFLKLSCILMKLKLQPPEKTEDSPETAKRTEEPSVKVEEKTEEPPEKAEEITEKPPVKAEEGTDELPEKAEGNVEEPPEKTEERIEESPEKAEEPPEKVEAIEEEKSNSTDNQHNISDVIKVYVDAIILLKTYAPMAKLEHVISNFHNVIDNYYEDICCSPPTFKKVFLEICAITAKLVSYSNLFGPLLVDLAAKFKKTNAEAHESFKNEIRPIVNALPDNSSKRDVLLLF